MRPLSLDSFPPSKAAEAPTRRTFLEVTYDSTNYCGWQIQPRDVSVQSELKHALSMLFRQPISVTGTGRTDAGVHAHSMMTHVNSLIPHPLLVQIQRGLCDILHGGISAHSVTPVIPTTYVRSDATSRRCHYYISACSNPFWGNHCWERRAFPDMELMNEACRHFIGERDFTSPSKLHTQTKHNRCAIYTVHWEQVEVSGLWDAMCYEVCINRFLHDMVRMMVGTLLEVGYGQRTPDFIAELIQRENRALAGSAIPTRALFPVEATYPGSIYNLDPRQEPHWPYTLSSHSLLRNSSPRVVVPAVIPMPFA